MISARMIADSIAYGNRISTMQVTMPRFILAQFNTHRVFSRNSASSRAIPTKKLIEKVRQEPCKPIRWGTAQRGMVAGEELPPDKREIAENLWRKGIDFVTELAKDFEELGVAKEIANRWLEIGMYTTVLVTATEWDNFFRLRLAHDAQPEMLTVAKMMWDCLEESQPIERRWHIPYNDRMPEGISIENQYKIATARCARLSYLTHDGETNIAKDIALHDQLKENGHMSPFEHCAKAMGNNSAYYNLRGWCSYRYKLEVL